MTPTTQSSTRNLTFHDGQVGRARRETLLGQRGSIVWCTGLSGAGKSTVARALEVRLIAEKKIAYVLDGDNVRLGLNADLGFSAADRQENIRRVGHVAALMADAGLIVLTAFISPFRADRLRVRELVGSERFVEVFVRAPLSVCEARDPKKLYEKARAGQIAEFTGLTSAYEPPDDDALAVDTDRHSVTDCVDRIYAELRRRGLLAAPSMT
ncbi:MAG: adenylyl-sulfate kinase [Thermoanaerobaculia bacterium]